MLIMTSFSNLVDTQMELAASQRLCSGSRAKESKQNTYVHLVKAYMRHRFVLKKPKRQATVIVRYEQANPTHSNFHPCKGVIARSDPVE